MMLFLSHWTQAGVELQGMLPSAISSAAPMPADAMAVYGRILLQAPAAIMQVCSAAAATPGLQGQLDPQQGQDHSSQVQYAGFCTSMVLHFYARELALPHYLLKVPMSGFAKRARLRLQQMCLWPCTTLLQHSRRTTIAHHLHLA